MALHFAQNMTVSSGVSYFADGEKNEDDIYYKMCNVQIERGKLRFYLPLRISLLNAISVMIIPFFFFTLPLALLLSLMALFTCAHPLIFAIISRNVHNLVQLVADNYAKMNDVASRQLSDESFINYVFLCASDFLWWFQDMRISSLALFWSLLLSVVHNFCTIITRYSFHRLPVSLLWKSAVRQIQAAHYLLVQTRALRVPIFPLFFFLSSSLCVEQTITKTRLLLFASAGIQWIKWHNWK